MPIEKYHIQEISRALARHDASTVYTLIREHFPEGIAGQVLLKLIKTQHDWPESRIHEDVYEMLLTPREMQVLRLSEQGLSEIEIARKIPLSYNTVKTHKKHLLLKLEAQNIMEAIHKGREMGLLK